MANTFWVPAGTEADDTSVGMPGAAPNGSQMQGNPNIPNGQPCGHAPFPQNPVQQLTGTQLSMGAIPTNLQPTNVLQGAGPANQGGLGGGDSLLAMMSRGQVIMADSTYGQGAFIPQNGGSSPQAQQPAAANTQPSTARVANVVTFAAGVTPNLSGM